MVKLPIMLELSWPVKELMNAFDYEGFWGSLSRWPVKEFMNASDYEGFWSSPSMWVHPPCWKGTKGIPGTTFPFPVHMHERSVVDKYILSSISTFGFYNGKLTFVKCGWLTWSRSMLPEQFIIISITWLMFPSATQPSFWIIWHYKYRWIMEWN